MKMTALGDCELAEWSLPELGALGGDREAATFEVTYGQASGVEIHKVSNLPSAVDQDRCFVLAFEHLAVVHEEPSGRAMTQRLGLELLELLDGNGVYVG